MRIDYSIEVYGMKALVIFDSFFGNTEKIARAVAGGMAQSAEVNATRVGDLPADHLAGVELLVVGSPTRGFRASPLIKEYLKNLPKGSLQGVRVAAFDTGFSAQKVKEINNFVLNLLVPIFGYAAKPISSQLVSKGGALACDPQGFFVRESEGPLEDGELERAAEWGRRLISIQA
jgi:flavodoxin I